MGNGSQQYFTEVTTSTKLTPPADDDADDTYDESQPQPLTDLNPSAGNFAAVRNRFEQLSVRANTNGAETSATLVTPLNQGAVKRLSGNFEEPPLQVPWSFSVQFEFEFHLNLKLSRCCLNWLHLNCFDGLQKSFVHIGAPELSEGALSRTVIISSLQLERSDSSVGGVGPESPVPNLEPPC